MTVRTRYDESMQLLSVQTQGFWWCLLLFFVFFFAVHAVRLAFLVRALSKKSKPEKPPDPVYFLVERKKKRPKKEFSEPKQISFR